MTKVETSAAGQIDGQISKDPAGRRSDEGAGTAGMPLLQLVGELSLSLWGLAALACADEAGLLEHLGEARSPQDLESRTGVPAPFVEAVLDVLLALGLVRRDGKAFISQPALSVALAGTPRELLRAELRSFSRASISWRA